MKGFIKTTLVASTLCASSIASAAVWQVTSVLQGNDGGYGYSSFHDANDNTPMSGPKLADITGVVSGSYNDVTGAFNAVLSITDLNTPPDAGPTVTLSGVLTFDANGYLNPATTLSVDFAGADGTLLRDTTIGFLPGDICCNGTGDPNSFKTGVNGGGTDPVMSLWGADWSYSGGGDFNGSYEGSKLGMDVRLQLTAVPVPAAVWLFGSGLLGLAGIARRRS